MKLTPLEQKLMGAARATVPSDFVPYAFEQRIMARLAGAQPMDVAALWSRALWRAAVPCMAIALAVGAWAFWQGQGSGLGGGSPTLDFSQELESAVFVMVDQPRESW